MLAAANVATAFHHNLFRALSDLAGTSQWVPFCFTFCFLPFLVMVLTIRDNRRFKREHRPAS